MADAKRCFWATLTAAALLAIWTGPLLEETSAARRTVVSAVVVQAFCREMRAFFAAAHAPRSDVARREFVEPESQHLPHAPEASAPPPLPPFVPSEDGQPAVMMRYNQQNDSVMAAIMASGMFGWGDLDFPQQLPAAPDRSR